MYPHISTSSSRSFKLGIFKRRSSSRTYGNGRPFTSKIFCRLVGSVLGDTVMTGMVDGVLTPTRQSLLAILSSSSPHYVTLCNSLAISLPSVWIEYGLFTNERFNHKATPYCVVTSLTWPHVPTYQHVIITEFQIGNIQEKILIKNIRKWSSIYI